MLEAKLINVSLSRLLGKRSFSTTIPQASNLASNNSISDHIYNRNPRNLERLRIAHKPTGYGLDDKPINYWHRLVISQSNRHVQAHIEHFGGNTVVSASTKEWAIKQFLRSTTDQNAAAAVGKVLAQRCLECGLLEVQSHYKTDSVSPKVSLILKAIEEAGVSLQEPDRFLPHRHWSREAQENPTQVYEETR